MRYIALLLATGLAVQQAAATGGGRGGNGGGRGEGGGRGNGGYGGNDGGHGGGGGGDGNDGKGHGGNGGGGGYWGSLPPFHKPGYGVCTPEQEQGCDFGGIVIDNPIGNYQGYDFGGFFCKGSNLVTKRDFLPRGLSRRTFGRDDDDNDDGRDRFAGNCARGRLSENPYINVPDDKDMNIETYHVSSDDDDAVFEAHYDMPDGSKCVQQGECKRGGNIIKNTQCGGAKRVTFKKPQTGKDCNFNIHHIKWGCKPPPVYNTPEIPTPKPTKPPAQPTPSYPTGGEQTTPETTPKQPDTSAPPESTTSEVPPPPPGQTYPTGEQPTKETTTSPVESTSEFPPTYPVEEPPVTTSETPYQPPYANSSVPVTTPMESPTKPTPPTPGETYDTSVPVPPESPPAETTSTTSPPAPPGETYPTGVPPTSPETTPADSTSNPAPPPSSYPAGPPSPESSYPAGEQPPPSSTQPLPANCPTSVPRCIRTFLEDLPDCSDDATDSSCYCASYDFTKAVMDCVNAHKASDAEAAEAMAAFAGVCAPQLGANPAPITYKPAVPPANPPAAPPSPPAAGETPAAPEAPPAPTPAPSYPADVPLTTLTIETSQVVPCTYSTGQSAGLPIPSSSTTVAVSTVATVPQVGFATVDNEVVGSAVPELVQGPPALPATEPSGAPAETTTPAAGADEVQETGAPVATGAAAGKLGGGFGVVVAVVVGLVVV